MSDLREKIEAAYENRALLDQQEFRQAVFDTLEQLNQGCIRVAEKQNGQWQVNLWVKEAILLYFVIAEMSESQSGPFCFFDKIPLKQSPLESGYRAVPGAIVRYGSFVARGAILMPCFINLGAYVGERSMVDTWATIGSCAQIGKNVHISGGVGIGGVLEPPALQPVVIEDGAFIGSRAIVVEGALIEQEAVLGANVTITASTPIIDVSSSQGEIYRGRVPARSVVIPGTTRKRFPAGEYEVSCALIIGKRKESTDQKTSLNEVVREFSISL